MNNMTNQKSLVKLGIHDKDLETAVLDHILWFEENNLDIFMLEEYDFYSLDNKMYFNEFKKIVEGGQLLSPLTLTGDMRKFVMENTSNMRISSHLPDLIKKLKEISAKRKIQEMCQRTEDKIAENRNLAELKNYMINYLESIDIEQKTKIIQNEEIDKILVEKLINKKNYLSISTGFHGIDYVLGGFFPETLTIIGGYSGSGKSTLILNMVNHMCAAGRKVLFVSCEMGYVLLQSKLISLLTGINSMKFVNTKYTFAPDELEDINRARETIANYKLYRMGDEGTKIADIKNEMKMLEDIEIIFIDYLQLLDPDIRSEFKHVTIADISRKLKQLTRKTGIPIVAISHLNQEHKLRKDKRPVLGDLGESGKIQYDADAVIFLHREAITRPYDPKKDGSDEDEWKAKCELILAKNRYGVSYQTFKLRYDMKKNKFYNVKDNTGE